MSSFLLQIKMKVLHKCKGVYFACDGGYPKDSYLINPFAARSDMAEVNWSEWLESIRKDAECTFGGLESQVQNIT